VELNDVTLREGNQIPGRDYGVEERIEAGRALDELGVTFVQAGFPVTGERDREVVSTLAANLDADVVGIARAVPGDVEAALDANADVVEVFGPLGDHHLESVVGKSRSEMLEAFRTAVDRLHDGGTTVHLSLLDAFRTDVDHLLTAFERFPDVEYINLADTVGARTPAAVERRLAALSADVDPARAGVHFHDDLGVATANVLVADARGVGKADVSVGGLGERAGNVPLEEVVVAGVLDRNDSFGMDEDRLVPTCDAVLSALGESIDERKAVLGREATRHESGLHTAAMLDDPSTFEPYSPDRFGGDRTLVFGSGTGSGGARRLLERAGIDAADEHVADFLDRIASEGPVTTEEATALAVDTYGE